MLGPTAFRWERFSSCRSYSSGEVGSAFVSETAENCRKKAAACWRAARRARDPTAKRQFEELAQAWLRLAERAEHDYGWRTRFVNDEPNDAD